jgi:sulfatase modifying factor 1
MMKSVFFQVAAFVVVANACGQELTDNLVFVEGATFRHTKSVYFDSAVAIPSFYIGKYEVTQKEWVAVSGSNPSTFKGDNLPVETVSWYDCVEYCNKRSLKEGLRPYYTVNKEQKDPNNKTEMDDVRWRVTINPEANGYRLPTEAEWEYAAGGGHLSKSYVYSGSDDVDKVAWYWKNSGDEILTGSWHWATIEQNNNRTKAVGANEPNELGLYDMSGNVREWCWNWYGTPPSNETGPEASTRETGRIWKGGGWIGGEHCCTPSFRGNFEASGRGPDQGLRVCRSK